MKLVISKIYLCMQSSYKLVKREKKTADYLGSFQKKNNIYVCASNNNKLDS